MAANRSGRVSLQARLPSRPETRHDPWRRRLRQALLSRQRIGDPDGGVETRAGYSRGENAAQRQRYTGSRSACQAALPAPLASGQRLPAVICVAKYTGRDEILASRGPCACVVGRLLFALCFVSTCCRDARRPSPVALVRRVAGRRRAAGGGVRLARSRETKGAGPSHGCPRRRCDDGAGPSPFEPEGDLGSPAGIVDGSRSRSSKSGNPPVAQNTALEHRPS